MVIGKSQHQVRERVSNIIIGQRKGHLSIVQIYD